MDSFLEMDYEDRNGGIDPFDEDEDDYDEDGEEYEDGEFHYDSPSLQDTIAEWPSYAN